MGHDSNIIEAIRKHRLGQGAVTCIGEPSVGGGESPDMLSWFPPESGPYWTLLDEYKESEADLKRDGDKPHRQGAGVGDLRVLIVRTGVWNPNTEAIIKGYRGAGWGVTVMTKGYFIYDWWQPRTRATKDKRTEDRILHDEFQRMRRQIAQMEGGGSRQQKGSGSGGLKPYHHDALDSRIGQCAGFRDIVAVLKAEFPKLTDKQIRALANEALDEGAPGFTVIQAGQDRYLERQTQTQEA